ncbi:MAG: HK97 gp10 family phage protein [Ruminococcus sp.]|nr:HK97 gp10 family phage protein [Ruminococcus sp.]
MASDADFRSSASRNRYKGVKSLSLEDLADYLQNECDIITKDTEKLLKDSADELKEKIKEDSPYETGEYMEGWVISKRQKPGEVEYIVRNKDKYQLTHLLEHGHDNPLTGNRVNGIPHINKNADDAIRKCGDRIDADTRKAAK